MFDLYMECFTVDFQKAKDKDLYLEISEQLSDHLTSRPGLRDEVVIDDRLKETVGWRSRILNNQGFPFIVIVGKRV